MKKWKKCKICNKDFENKNKKSNFCSRECRYKSVSQALIGHSNNKGQKSWNVGLKGLKGRYYCPSKIDIWEVLSGKHSQMTSADVRNKLLAERIFEDKCQICGWSKKREGYPFSTCHLHHKNGDNRDHRLENLQLLCPNCHSLTDTFCKMKKSVGKLPNRTYDENGKVIFRYYKPKRKSILA